MHECLNSVLDQTYKDYEIIVVDDGSRDTTKDVLKPYFDKIKYIYKENGGVASARNVGIKNASGEYIAWLDSDDKWLPYKLELQMDIFNKLPDIGLIHSDFACFTEKNGRLFDSYIKQYFHILNQYHLDFNEILRNSMQLQGDKLLIANNIEKVNVYWDDISDKAILGPMFLPSTVIIKKSCIDKIGLFNEKYKTAEDLDFHLRIAKLYEISYIDIPTVEYRRFHFDQLSSENMELESNLNWLNITISLGLNDVSYYRKNKTLVDMRLSHCYYGLGTVFYKNQNNVKAFKYFIKSLRINLKQRKIYFYTCLSLFRMMTIDYINYVFSIFNKK